MFKLLTRFGAGVRSLTISFLLLLLLFVCLFVCLFLAFLWTKTNSRFIKTQETTRRMFSDPDQKSLVNGICYMVKIGFSTPIAKHKAGFSLCRSPTCGSR